MPTQSSRRVFAIIPACGASRRMGTSKLLLELAGKTFIRRLAESLNGLQIAAVCVLIRADDQALKAELQTCENLDVIVADPSPSDMKESVQQLLTYVQVKWTPTDRDAWLLIPGDHPVVESAVLDRLWKESRNKIIVPVHEGRRGHPTLFPWWCSSEVFQLPDDSGVNFLLQDGERVHEVPCPEPSVLWDIDTPEDYERVSGHFCDSTQD